MEIVDFIKQSPLRTFKRGEILLQKGDPLTRLFAVRDGFIKVTSINEDGAERLLWIAKRYDIAPTEQFFAKHGSARYFYTALTDGSYYNVSKEAVLARAESDPEVMSEIAYSMSVHYDDFLQRIDAVDNATVKERLLRTLYYLAEYVSSATDTVDLFEYGLQLTHQDFATMIGSTRETTSLTLAELRKQGYIQYSRRNYRVNLAKIREAVE